MTNDIARIQQIERQLAFIKMARKNESYMGCGIVIDFTIGVPDENEPCNPMRTLSNINLCQGEDTILAAIESALAGSLRDRISMLQGDYIKIAEFLQKRGAP